MADHSDMAPPPRRLLGSRDFWLGVIAGGLVVGGAVFVLRGGGGSETGTASTTGGTTTTVPVRPPQQVRVEVLNASGVEGAASTKAFQLGGLGYVIAGVGNADFRTGTIVQCRVGFEREAAALAKDVGAGTAVRRLPPSASIDLTKVDCRVTLGS